MCAPRPHPGDLVPARRSSRRWGAVLSRRGPPASPGAEGAGPLNPPGRRRAGDDISGRARAQWEPAGAREAGARAGGGGGGLERPEEEAAAAARARA